MTAKLTEAQRDALALLRDNWGGISTDDPRCDRFSDDAQPLDTWGRLFEAGLAEQWGPGIAGDEFSLRITEAGRLAKSQTRSQQRKCG